MARRTGGRRIEVIKVQRRDKALSAADLKFMEKEEFWGWRIRLKAHRPKGTFWLAGDGKSLFRADSEILSDGETVADDLHSVTVYPQTS
jgi:hypothetical protein